MRRFCSGVNSTTEIRRLEPGMQAHGISAFAFSTPDILAIGSMAFLYGRGCVK
jgi:hypothetical protein